MIDDNQRAIDEMLAVDRIPDPYLRFGEDLPEGAIAVVIYHPSTESRLGPEPACSSCFRVWVL